MAVPELHTGRRLRRAAAVLSLAVLLPAAPAAAGAPDFTDPVPPRPVRYFNGLEPGVMLGGVRLPVDWSTRQSPCPSDPTASHFWLRVAPTMHPPLCPGDRSEAVVNLQILLRDKLLYRGPITGEFDRRTQYAVYAFHKLVGPAHPDPRTAVGDWLADPPPGDWTEDDWRMLEDFDPKPPKARVDQPDRVEVDIGHQVMYLIHDDEVVAIMPVSTGRGYGERGCRQAGGCDGLNVTPRTERMEQGSYFYGEHTYWGGWSPLPDDWSIYKAIFYYGQYGEWNYGLHGYRDVPNYPASHGCTRLTVWDMDFLRPAFGRSDPETAMVWTGMVIHVWDE